jgi:hypothetical protein
VAPVRQPVESGFRRHFAFFSVILPRRGHATNDQCASNVGNRAQPLCILSCISYPRGVMSDPVQSTSEQPKWARPDFREFYKEKCVVEQREDGATWHLGSGIGPAAHPLAHSIPMSQFDCAACGGIYPYLTVVAATQGAKNTYGEGPWSYEFVCDGCGKYNQVVREG